MTHHGFIVAFIGLITLISVSVEGRKQRTSMSVLQDEDEEVTVVPSVVSSSASISKRRPAYNSPGPSSISHYYDYSPSTGYGQQSQSSYSPYSKYYSGKISINLCNTLIS